VCLIWFQVHESKIDDLNKDAIPGAKDAVRIDLVGGYAIKKVTSERSAIWINSFIIFFLQ